MIGFLEGEILEKAPDHIVVKVGGREGGVGYQVQIPLSTFYALPEPPARVALQIHTRIQDEALSLYGFISQAEKDLFLQLLGIPRIGPRMALNILSGINPEEFAQALAQGDTRRLAGIPGIGKKSADRIVLELRDRPLPASRARAAPGEGLLQDALSALTNLGYPKTVAQKALDEAWTQGYRTLEDLLRQSLKLLAR